MRLNSASSTSITPIISIITPIHQGMKTLEETAHSVLSQTFQDFEWLIVVDDEHLQAYQALLNTQDHRIKWFVTPHKASGPSVARNIGINHVKGEFICYLDADDLMVSHRLETLLPLAKTYGAAVDLHQAFDDESKKILGTCLPESLRELMTIQAFYDFDFPFCPLYKAALDVRWHEDIRFAEDVLFNHELLSCLGVIAVCHKALLCYRVHDQSACHNMPTACHVARDNYTKILDLLASNNEAKCTKREKLMMMFERKKSLNEDYLRHYLAGNRQSFFEFARLPQ